MVGNIPRTNNNYLHSTKIRENFVKRLFLRNIFVRLNKISEKTMKTQAKNTLGFINIALLLLFLFGISSCSALQIGKDIKTQLFQENGNVFYISSTYSFGVI